MLPWLLEKLPYRELPWWAGDHGLGKFNKKDCCNSRLIHKLDTKQAASNSIAPRVPYLLSRASRPASHGPGAHRSRHVAHRFLIVSARSVCVCVCVRARVSSLTSISSGHHISCVHARVWVCVCKNHHHQQQKQQQQKQQQRRRRQQQQINVTLNKCSTVDKCSDSNQYYQCFFKYYK